MKEKMKRLELEQILSQIYSNDYIYDESVQSFSFNGINFININDIYFYTHNIIVELQYEYLVVKNDNMQCEIKYRNIKNFLINFREH